MPLTIRESGKGNKDFENPKPGVYTAVFESFTDLGMQPGYNPGEMREKLRCRWQLGETDSAGNRFTVIKEYTKSLNEKSNLRKDLEAIFGAFDEQDLRAGVDIDSYIGKGCQLAVDEKISKSGNPYTIVTALMPLGQGMEPLQLEVTEPAEDDEPPF